MWKNRLRNTKKAIVVELPDPDQSELSNYSSEEEECSKTKVLNEAGFNSSSNSDSSSSDSENLKSTKIKTKAKGGILKFLNRLRNLIFHMKVTITYPICTV